MYILQRGAWIVFFFFPKPTIFHLPLYIDYSLLLYLQYSIFPRVNTSWKLFMRKIFPISLFTDRTKQHDRNFRREMNIFCGFFFGFGKIYTRIMENDCSTWKILKKLTNFWIVHMKNEKKRRCKLAKFYLVNWWKKLRNESFSCTL